MSYWASGLGPIRWLTMCLARINSPRLGENWTSSFVNVHLGRKSSVQTSNVLDLHTLCVVWKLNLIYSSIQKQIGSITFSNVCIQLGYFPLIFVTLEKPPNLNPKTPSYPSILHPKLTPADTLSQTSSFIIKSIQIDPQFIPNLDHKP